MSADMACPDFSLLTLAQLHSVERLVFGDHTFLNAASVKLVSGVSCEA